MSSDQSGWSTPVVCLSVQSLRCPSVLESGRDATSTKPPGPRKRKVSLDEAGGSGRVSTSRPSLLLRDPGTSCLPTHPSPVPVQGAKGTQTPETPKTFLESFGLSDLGTVRLPIEGPEAQGGPNPRTGTRDRGWRPDWNLGKNLGHPRRVTGVGTLWRDRHPPLPGNSREGPR